PAHPEDAPVCRAPRGRATARLRAVPGPGGGGCGTVRRGATRSDAGTAEPPCGARRADQAGRDVAATMLSRSSAAPQISSTTVERVPEAGEEALLAGGELAGRVLLATQLGELPEQLLLLGVEAGGGLDVDVDERVAPAALVEVRHAAPVQRDDLAGLGAGPDVDLLGAVERVDHEGGAEGGRGHRDVHGAVEGV